VSEQSQRNPGNLALFGIKNARRSAGQDKLVIGRGVNQQISRRPPAWLKDRNLSAGDDVIDFPVPAPLPVIN